MIATFKLGATQLTTPRHYTTFVSANHRPKSLIFKHYQLLFIQRLTLINDENSEPLHYLLRLAHAWIRQFIQTRRNQEEHHEHQNVVTIGIISHHHIPRTGILTHSPVDGYPNRRLTQRP